MRYFFITPWRFEKGAATQNLFTLYRERVDKQIPCEHIFPASTPPDKQAATKFLCNTLEKMMGTGTIIVCLDENGKAMSSRKFSEFLQIHESRGTKQILFCVGGAYGLPADILENNKNVSLISLSAMTFPHEMALAMLAEQVYRARTILGGHPYHHEEASELFQSTQ